MMREKILEGTTICPGIAIGKTVDLSHKTDVRQFRISSDQTEEEQKRYAGALERVRAHLYEHIESVHADSYFSAKQIIDIHELMIEDKSFHESIQRRISTEFKNAEWALIDESERITNRLKESRDSYLQARIEDVLDLVENILAALSLPEEKYRERLRKLYAHEVLISTNLFISEVMLAKRFSIRGLATESGALSSHAAILLKSFGIPAIGRVRDLRRVVKSGDEIVVDGIDSRVIVRPTPETIKNYRILQEQTEKPFKVSMPSATETRTIDGTQIHLLGNVDNQSQIKYVVQKGLEGVGLFRTEFLVRNAGRVPDEEEQYRIYRQTIDTLAGRDLVFRTFDLGADKQAPGLGRCEGANPAMGIRGIRRHILRRPEEFLVQVRAMLRAAAGIPVGVLVPMVTTVEDIRKAKKYITQAQEELDAEGSAFSPDVRIGAMIEVPAAAIAIRAILSEVQFVSIGTNDLIQYMVAADRDNEAVLHYGDIHNESILFLLHFIIDRGVELGREADITICGELASDPQNIPLLLGMGYRSLSISPVAAHSIRNAISNTDLI